MKKKILWLMAVVCILVLSCVPVSAEGYTYGFIIDSEVSSNGVYDVAQLKMLSSENGDEVIYSLAEKVRINGDVYNDSDAMVERIPVESSVRFVQKNGKITHIDYDKLGSMHINLKYNCDTNKMIINGIDSDLPVFSGFDGKISLDGNHTYIADVYDYGIVVNDYKADDKQATVLYADIYDFVYSADKLGICVEWGISNNDCIVAGELYDENSNLIDTQRISADMECFEFGGLKNEIADYSVKIWLENNDGNVISYVYTYNFTTEPIEFFYGKVLQMAESASGFAECYLAKISDAERNEAIYEISSRVFLNGEIYRIGNDIYIEDLDSTDITLYPAKLGMKDGKICVINYGGSWTEYENVSYDVNGRFVIDGVDTSDMEIYPFENYIDENHVYTISVSDYGIDVIEGFAKDKTYTLTCDVKSDYINSDFERTIYLECDALYKDGDEIKSATDLTLKGEIYDSSSELLFTSTGKFVEEGIIAIEFPSLPNRDADYTVKLWFADSNGDAVSCVYTYEYSIEEIDVAYGKINAMAFNNSGFNNNVIMQVLGTDGTKTVYNLRDKMYINGNCVKTSSIESFEDMIDSYMKFAYKDNDIIAFAYSKELRYEGDAAYDENDRTFHDGNNKLSRRSVYYDADDCYLGGDHIYDVKVYDYAVIVNDFRARDKEQVIRGSGARKDVNRDFTNNISVGFNPTQDNSGIFVGELYRYYEQDASEQSANYSSALDAPIDVQRVNLADGESEIVFSSLPNENALYTVKFYLEDENGAALSPEYTQSQSTVATETGVGQITRVWDYDDIEITINGNKYIFDLNTSLVNGEAIDSGDVLEEYERRYVKYSAENGIIGNILIEEGTTYENATYDSQTGKFTTADGELNQLPVYGDGIDVYLDENHVYAITAYSYAVVIHIFEPKDDAFGFSYIVTDVSMNSALDGINIRIEAGVPDDYIGYYAAELYDSNGKKIFEENDESCYIEEDGFFITILTAPNDTASYTVKVWLKNEEGNCESIVYNIECDTEYVPVLSGRALEFDLESNWILSVNGISNDTMTFELIDAEYVVINGRAASGWNSMRVPINVPRNVAVRFVCDELGYVTAIAFDDEYEIYVSECNYTPADGENENRIEISADIINPVNDEMNGKLYDVLYRGDTIEDVHALPFENSVPFSSEERSFGFVSVQLGDVIKLFLWDTQTTPYNSKCSYRITSEYELEKISK